MSGGGGGHHAEGVGSNPAGGGLGRRGGVARVTEALLRLAVAQPPAEPRRSASVGVVGGEEEREPPLGGACSSTSSGCPGHVAPRGSPTATDPIHVDPRRAVATLARCYAGGEKYADVRAAIAASLPRVTNPPDFLLACVEHLATTPRQRQLSTPADDDRVDAATCHGEQILPDACVVRPLVQLMLEALGQTCVTHTPRPTFAIVDPRATAVTDPAARRRAAATLVDVTRGAVAAAWDGTVPSLALEPRAVARLASTVGLNLEDLRAVDVDANDAADASSSASSPRRVCAPEHALTWYVGRCLGSGEPSSVAAAAALTRHFSLDAFVSPTALDALQLMGHGASADALAACLPPAQRRGYMRRLQRVGGGGGGKDGGVSPAERAERTMRRLGLPATFPNEARARAEGRLRQLAAAGRWDVAAALAGTDEALRESLRRLREARREGAVRDAAREDVDSSSGHLPAFLSLDVPPSAVRVVDDVEGLAGAAASLEGDAVVGLDSEWRPDTWLSGGSSKATCQNENRTAVLQLAGERSVVVLDMTALGERHPEALAAALRRILVAPRPIRPAAVRSEEEEASPSDRPPLVLGFGIAEDLRRLVRTHPGPVARVAASIPHALCLQHVAASMVRGGYAFGWGSTPGLSAVAEALLGLPLDKTETCGDWEARPLREAQVRYAALDARVLVRLLPGLLSTSRADAPAAARAMAAPAADLIRESHAASDTPRRSGSGNGSGNAPSSAVSASVPALSAAAAAALRARLPSAGGDPAVIDLDLDLNVADTLARHPHAVVKSIGIMVSVPGGREVLLRVGGVDPVAAALGGIGGGSTGFKGRRAGTPRVAAPAVLLLRGTDRVDLKAVAAHFGVSRRHVRLATPEECVVVFGYPPGSMPPFGHRVECPTLIDAAVSGSGSHALGGKVFPGAGAPNLVFGCLPGVLERAAAAVVAPIALGANPPGFPDERVGSNPTGGADVNGIDTSAAAAADKNGPTALLKAVAGESSAVEGTGDIETSSPPARHRFVADGNLGRLARWLRCLGVDAEHVPSGAAGQYGALLALAARDDRVILTRDRRLLQQREAVGAYLVEDDDPKRQLAQVSAHFGLTFERGRLLTRCATCNGEVERRCTPEEVAASTKIPEKVKRATSDFWACGRCEKVYWIGPKSHMAMDFINSEVRGALVDNQPPEARRRGSDPAKEDLLEEALGGNPWPRDHPSSE